ncbi:cyclin-L1-1-like isoform X2 [Quercus robur]|uniref:cyclin-L1-1-like isoform X2 n=1 Tax=Quercus robur TaxID=38942 RepID=UPI002163493E|nr:cyclin-L1-1-like isoform X2 [Quercus robur]
MSSMVIGARDALTIIKYVTLIFVLDLKLCRPSRFYNIVSIARNRLPASILRIECTMENLPIEHLEIGSQKYHDLKTDLSRTERHILKEMGFVCHVEHPRKFISNYLAILETPPELRQEAWNLANDS